MLFDLPDLVFKNMISPDLMGLPDAVVVMVVDIAVEDVVEGGAAVDDVVEARAVVEVVVEKGGCGGCSGRATRLPAAPQRPYSQHCTSLVHFLHCQLERAALAMSN